MKKKVILFLMFLYAGMMVSAQVGINNDGTQPNNSAMLDVKSENKGLLPPRMSSIQRNGIASPAPGLLIFNTDCNDMQYYNSAGWIPLGNTGMLSTPGAITGNTTPCVNATGISYSVTSIPGVTGYHWTVPAGASITAGQGTNSITVSFGTTSGVICVATYNDCYKSTMSCLSVTLMPALPVSVSILPSSNPVCAGTSVTFTASPVNGGSTPGYQWKKNGINISGATNVAYSFIPLNGDILTCLLTSNVGCGTGSPALSNAVIMTVNVLMPVSVTIVVSANPVCSGTNVTFTATPVNGGTTPAYQWKKNGINISGATNVTYSYTPANGDAITCSLTSSLTCKSGSPALSNSITMTVNTSVVVSITIVSSANPSCVNNSVTFTATPVNGGTTPAYQWIKGGIDIPGATNNTHSYVPANGDILTCRLTSSLLCKSVSPAISNPISQVVNQPSPVSVTVSANASLVCSGTVVTYTAIPVNGGSAPAFQWLKNDVNIPGATNATYAYAPAGVDVIKCKLTSSGTCISSNPAYSSGTSVTVIPSQPVSITITASPNPFCTGGSVTLSSNPINGGTAPGYQWKVNGTNVLGASNSSYTYNPANNDQVQCVLISNILCASGSPATSNTITLLNTLTVNHVVGVVAPVSKLVTYGTVKNIPGETSKCWITRNLGASQQPAVVSDATEASAGWYWQFNLMKGYKHDGSTLTPSWTITGINESSDWLAINDPCSIELGTQWRIPTYTEWYNVDNTGPWVSWNGPWLSGLKLHAAGYLGNSNGSLIGRGSNGDYWSNTQNSTSNGWHLTFDSGTSYIGNNNKAFGFSLRCIRD
jgi:hypothetical protein